MELADLRLPPFTLGCGVRLPRLHVRAWTWGPTPWRGIEEVRHTGSVSRCRERIEHPPAPVPLPKDAPVVLVIHALTGDARVGGEGGWWSELVGPGRPLDPTRQRIVCINNLGSCYGTYGPADSGFPNRGALPSPDASVKGGFALPPTLPAPLTTWDQARAIWLALDALGVDRVEQVIGGSLGGMIAQAVVRLAPQRVGRLWLLATAKESTPWTLAFNHLGRQAIVRHGDLALAREVAHLSYRSPQGLADTQDRPAPGPGAPAPAATYLTYQGKKLRLRFEASAYLSQLDAMDHHGDAWAPEAPDPSESWERVHGWDEVQLPVRLLGITSDVLFPPRDVDALGETLRQAGVDVGVTFIDHPQGHDGFLLAVEQVTQWLEAEEKVAWVA